MVDGSSFDLNYFDIILNSLFHGIAESWITASNGATVKLPSLSWYDKPARVRLNEEFSGINYFTLTSTKSYLAIDNVDIAENVGLLDGADLDGDGVVDLEDNCSAVSNAYQDDVDADGIGDVCDSCPNDPYDDIDADGLCGDIDNCPEIANANQFDFDQDGMGNSCDEDDDNDSLLDEDDNCRYDYNPEQEDFDRDGIGDLCDQDVDGDDVVDGEDECLGTFPGDVVDSAGCSVSQLCPCDNDWKNHGDYVKCLTHQLTDFVNEGLISHKEKGSLTSMGARSSCGRKK
jgi:hypothetical protein